MVRRRIIEMGKFGIGPLRLRKQYVMCNYAL
jgi:hypothetical protein